MCPSLGESALNAGDNQPSKVISAGALIHDGMACNFIGIENCLIEACAIKCHILAFTLIWKNTGKDTI